MDKYTEKSIVMFKKAILCDQSLNLLPLYCSASIFSEFTKTNYQIKDIDK